MLYSLQSARGTLRLRRVVVLPRIRYEFVKVLLHTAEKTYFLTSHDQLCAFNSLPGGSARLRPGPALDRPAVALAQLSTASISFNIRLRISIEP